MKKLSPSQQRRLKRLGPLLIVAFVSLIIVLDAVGSLTQSRVSASFEPYFPSPTLYTPGANLPNTVLRINYSGPGLANYTYIVTYNSGAGEAVADKGTVLLRGSTSSTIFLLIPVPLNGGVVARAEVYHGVVSAANLVYSKSITL